MSTTIQIDNKGKSIELLITQATYQKDPAWLVRFPDNKELVFANINGVWAHDNAQWLQEELVRKISSSLDELLKNEQLPGSVEKPAPEAHLF